ncbi:hypothetical protein Ocin01_11898 [Orchesella cincta]|uniref:Apple domain-containing protein n=1 Tax=Orchesella cincta TaxID=48709 RepID=A0A1D2MP14_ORCCI|nr:hypothetical protein Ocin01_11898 [Orchesella cincta]
MKSLKQLLIMLIFSTVAAFDYLKALDKCFGDLPKYYLYADEMVINRRQAESCRSQNSDDNEFCQSVCQLLDLEYIGCGPYDAKGTECWLIAVDQRYHLESLTAISEYGMSFSKYAFILIKPQIYFNRNETLDETPAPAHMVDLYQSSTNPPPKTTGEIATIILENVEARLKSCTFQQSNKFIHMK